jgi:hypothetical protein
MMLVFLELKTGYLLQEEGAEARTYPTWKAVVEERLKALGTPVLSVVSDAEQGLECFSMPDFFHCVHEMVKSHSLALGRHVRHAHQALTDAQEALARLQGRPHAAHATAGEEASGGNTLGRGPPHLSQRLGNALIHATSLPPGRLGSANLRTG